MTKYYVEKRVIIETKSWKEIKNIVFGEKGIERRDEFEREYQTFKEGKRSKTFETKRFSRDSQ